MTTVLDNGDGTWTAPISDNGDGTWTASSFADNGDGTWTSTTGSGGGGGGTDVGAISATPLPDDAPPRVLLIVNAPTASQVTITRVNADGTRSTIRDANPKALVSGAAAVYDYDVPYGQAVTYTATTDTTVPATTAPVTLNVSEPWLLHPGIPTLSQPVTIHSIGDQSADTLQGIHYVLGREMPVVVSDGVRHAPTFDVILTTSTPAAAALLKGLLADASPLLLQAAYGYTAETFYAWVSVGQVTRSPYNRFVHPGVVWTLSCTEVDRPAGLLQTNRTFADVAAQFLTFADLRDNYARMIDVYTDTPIGT